MKLAILISMILILTISFGCTPNTENAERAANLDKIEKFAENAGEDFDRSKAKDMSDEEIRDAAQYIKDNGEFDMEKIMEDSFNEQESAALDSAEEYRKKSKSFILNEIVLDCSINRDSKSKKMDGAIVELFGRGEDKNGEYVDTVPLDGTIKMDIYGVVEDKNSFSLFKEFSKGNLIESYDGQVEDIFDAEEEVIWNKIYFNYKKLVLAQDIIDSAEEIQYTEEYFDEEYEYSYYEIPIWIDISFTDTGGQTYRDVLRYDPVAIQICDIMIENPE